MDLSSFAVRSTVRTDVIQVEAAVLWRVHQGVGRPRTCYVLVTNGSLDGKWATNSMQNGGVQKMQNQKT